MEKLTLIIATLAFMASVVSIYFSLIHVRADFTVSQNVKKDTITLMSTLVSLVHKGAIYTQQDKTNRDDKNSSSFVDISHEKLTLQEFMTSPTAYAYLHYAARKSSEAREKHQPEVWRNIFLDMTILASESNPHHAAAQAAKIMKSYFDFSEDNSFEEVLIEVKRLSDAIDIGYTELSGNLTVLTVYDELADELIAKETQ